MYFLCLRSYILLFSRGCHSKVVWDRSKVKMDFGRPGSVVSCPWYGTMGYGAVFRSKIEMPCWRSNFGPQKERKNPKFCPRAHFFTRFRHALRIFNFIFVKVEEKLSPNWAYNYALLLSWCQLTSFWGFWPCPEIIILFNCSVHYVDLRASRARD